MFEIQVEFIKKCHLQCLHCSSYAYSSNDMVEFPINDLKNIIGKLSKKTIVYLTGGEPLASQSLQRQIEELSSCSKWVTIGLYTSGIIKNNEGFNFVSENTAKELKQAGLTETYFSIYDIIPQNHDQFTQLHNSLLYTTESIKNFIKAGIIAKVHIVINKLNYTRIENIISNLELLGINEIRILRLVKSGRAHYNWDIIGIDKNTQTDTMLSILKIRDTFKCNITFSGIPEYVGCRPCPQAIGCEAGRGLVYITYDGNVFPCACTRENASHLLCSIENFGNFDTTKYDNNKDCLNISA
jgi:MoaA/NifB/PqqE/SkfB family radical SAM enzyme